VLHQTGCLDIGGECFTGALAAARQHGLPHEVLTGAQANARFPGYRLPAEAQVLYEPQGGILAPEVAIQGHCRVRRGGTRLLRMHAC
jgi:sarcosine oxidase